MNIFMEQSYPCKVSNRHIKAVIKKNLTTLNTKLVIQHGLNGGISWVHSGGPVNDTIDYAIRSYGFLIPYGRLTSGEGFIKMIESYYDTSNPRDRCIVDALKTYLAK